MYEFHRSIKISFTPNAFSSLIFSRKISRFRTFDATYILHPSLKSCTWMQRSNSFTSRIASGVAIIVINQFETLRHFPFYYHSMIQGILCSCFVSSYQSPHTQFHTSKYRTTTTKTLVKFLDFSWPRIGSSVEWTGSPSSNALDFSSPGPSM